MPGRQLASVKTGAFCFSGKSFFSPTFHFSVFILEEFCLYDVIGAVCLSGIKHSSTDGSGKQVSKLQTAGIGFFISEHYVKGESDIWVVSTVTYPAELQFQFIILAPVTALKNNMGFSL